MGDSLSLSLPSYCKNKFLKIKNSCLFVFFKKPISGAPRDLSGANVVIDNAEVLGAG